MSLQSASLRSANLQYANLQSANLQSADLQYADLQYASLQSANLRSANLQYADLQYASLRSANLQYANLQSANLRSADLQSANGIDDFPLPEGVTLGEFKSGIVPQLLTAGGKTVADVVASGAWDCHEWENCPMHVALGIDSEEKAPLLLRPWVSRFVQLFDSGLIPCPADAPSVEVKGGLYSGVCNGDKETSTPGPAAAKWPRYARNTSTPCWTAKQLSDGGDWDVSLNGKLGVNSVNAVAGDNLISAGIWIETDAEGNALPNTDAKRATSNPPQDPPRPPKQSPQPDASGAERHRFDVFHADRNTEYVTAADHEQVVADLQRQLQIREAEIGIGGSPPPYPTWMQQVADRDATIAELRADRQYCFDQMKASDTRAEAAEAKCAEYRNTFTAANEMRLSEVRLRHQVQQRADALTAQLAAANDRIREAYAILCQLENVYRRQSTESVGSFGVSQEVHSLLKRAMDTLNGKEKQ